MQNENKTPPTLETYWNQELQSSDEEVKDKMKYRELPSLEETRDHYGKTGSVVKWISPVPDDTTATSLETETREFESMDTDFSEKELTEAENNIGISVGEFSALHETRNSSEDIF